MLNNTMATPGTETIESNFCDKNDYGNQLTIVHFWRVICHLLGIEDRFNICRESLSETKAVFNEIASAHYKRYVLFRHSLAVHTQLIALEGFQRMLFRDRKLF
ncbi:hypothetical protein Trydic_g11823 [Trypoxylus dichotomus]